MHWFRKHGRSERRRNRLLLIALCISSLVGLVCTGIIPTQAAAPSAATASAFTSEEYAAVQDVIGPDADAHHVLYSVMNATGNIMTRILARPRPTPFPRSVVGIVTIQDEAGLLTSVGKDRITHAAEQAHIRLFLITNNQPFPSLAAWRSWLRAHAGNAHTITIGLHAVPKQKNITVLPGAATKLSQVQADQGVTNALATFNGQGVTAGVLKLIETYHGMVATAQMRLTAPAC